MRIAEQLSLLRQRRLPVRRSRGDTYGVICASILLVCLVAGVVIFRVAAAKAPALARAANSQPTGNASSLNEKRAPRSDIVVPRSSEEQALNGGMETSRLLGEKHLTSHGVIAPVGGNFQAKFQYERTGALERLRANEGTFVRQGNSPWIRGEEWKADAASVSAVEISFLDDLVNIVRSPWQVASANEPTRSYPSSTAILYAKGADENKERLFSFGRGAEGIRLQRFSGLLHSGGDEVEVTLDYEYPDAPPLQTLLKQPSPAASPSIPRALSVGTHPRTKPRKRGKATRR